MIALRLIAISLMANAAIGAHIAQAHLSAADERLDQRLWSGVMGCAGIGLYMLGHDRKKGGTK